MGTKTHKPEEAVAKLRQVDVLASQVQSVADAIRMIGVTEVIRSPCDWISLSVNQQRFGGLIEGSMSRRGPPMADLVAHLSVSELEKRFTACRDARTARQTQAIWLLAQGHSFAHAAAATAFSERWV